MRAILLTAVAMGLGVVLAGCAPKGQPAEKASGVPAEPKTSAQAAKPVMEKPVPSRVQPPPPERSFRAAWVATVANIDWPSRPGLPVEQQKAEALAILDRAVSINLNAIILQVRTSADAFYDSKLEPWSEYLTGVQGQAPSPHYDPLAFWVEEAHKRGIELHAWFNPFRARVGSGRGERAGSHVSIAHPQWVKRYGGYLWLDPGVPEAQDHTFNVFMDVVKRYDVDGIHIDDYFYPYPEKAKPEDDAAMPFPDQESYGAYKAGGGNLAVEDWRRENINKMIERIYKGTHAIKPWVKFGISPFGIARPGKPKIAKGFDQYKDLYADAEKWLKEGWCDYMVPQLYWPIGAPNQAYLALLQWWTTNNPKQRGMYAGLFTSRIENTRESGWAPSEILGQIMINRLVEGAGGEVHFSMKALTQNRQGMCDQLRSGLYARPALVPASTWLSSDVPAAPQAVSAERIGAAEVMAALPIEPKETTVSEPAPREPATATAPAQGRERRRAHVPSFVPLATQPTATVERTSKLGGVRVSWRSATGKAPWLWAVYARQGDEWVMQVVPGHLASAVIRDASAKTATSAIAVAAVDRNGNESARTVIPVGK